MQNLLKFFILFKYHMGLDHFLKITKKIKEFLFPKKLQRNRINIKKWNISIYELLLNLNIFILNQQLAGSPYSVEVPIFNPIHPLIASMIYLSL
jgi:hypothetical protein